MKKSKKVICVLILTIILSLFVIKTTAYADVVDPYWHKSSSIRDWDFDEETLIKVIIVLISIILIMSVIILKHIYNKYKLEVKIVRKDAPGNVGAHVDFTESQEFKDELGEKVLEETKKENGSDDDKVRIEMDMTKLFAVMILIVGIIIIVSVL